ncbi:MAG TPA: BadF/BadG/BcrA/BcrD ATPase family protein [Spirochaetia bacterium]
MTYFLGVDGGGTKTACVVGDESGAVLGAATGPGSNHQTVGAAQTEAVLRRVVAAALAHAGVRADAVRFAIFGLAGADLPADFALLGPVCARVLGHARYRVLNDGWIGLKAGNPDYWGVVTSCGTGTCILGRTRDGREVALRNMTYELGNWGGGVDLARDAVRGACRSEEGTGPKTPLETEVPRALGVDSVAALVGPVTAGSFDPQSVAAAASLVFRLANEGDAVCQEILLRMGRVLGEMAGGVARRLELHCEEFPAVLTGSVFRGDSPLFIDEYTTTLHRAAPRARIVRSTRKPVMGAFHLALEEDAAP